MFVGEKQITYMRNSVGKIWNLWLRVEFKDHSRLGEIQILKLQADSITWVEQYLDRRKQIILGMLLKCASVCVNDHIHIILMRGTVSLFYSQRSSPLIDTSYWQAPSDQHRSWRPKAFKNCFCHRGYTQIMYISSWSCIGNHLLAGGEGRGIYKAFFQRPLKLL